MAKRNYFLQKYDRPVPRYTSYPTVPYWQNELPDEREWLQSVRQAVHKQNEISLYIHLPFCEKLCTYCGCHKRITKNHAVEHPYINSVLREWYLYLENLPQRPVLREIHLGGGTPTFFDPSNLRFLLERIIGSSAIPSNYVFSFEAHPNNTTDDHLTSLRQLGFNRISLGVQDFSPEIMQGINRRQELSDIIRVTEEARKLGYQSVNYDLVYGLPFQTADHIWATTKWIQNLKPDRIAYYSYAHVPWKKANQRGFTESDFAKGAEKAELYRLGSEAFVNMGYKRIAMDHFALPSDALYQALKDKKLHRNFMGYTSFKTPLLIGLGASAISDSWVAFAQNEPKVETYQKILSEGRLPVVRGHQLTKEDQVLRRHILSLMCHFKTNWSSPCMQTDTLQQIIPRLAVLAADGLVRLQKDGLEVTERGKPYIRNIALCFDERYWRRQPEENLFSQAV